MQRTVHLVQVNDVIGNNVILPLAVGIIWQYSQLDSNNQHNWRLGQIVYQRLDNDSQVAELAQGDMVVFSHYVWNSVYQFDLARQIKLLNPNITVVVGGPNISPDKRDFWQEHGDYVDIALVGEGEHSFSQLLQSWPRIEDVPGVWTRDYYNGEAERVQDFPHDASPYLSGFYQDIVRREQAQGRVIQAIIQTNRGCPYHCTFCEEGRDYKNKLFFYDQQRVRDEIEWCAQNRVEFINIADDNWGIVPQDVELMRWIRDCKLRYGYPDLIDATFAKNNPDNLLAIAAIDQEHHTQLLRGVTVALQSQHEPTLASIRRFNLIPHKQHQLITGLKQLGVPTYTEIIWPLPYETYSTFRAGIDRTISAGLTNWLGVYPLSMHPGTELYNDFHTKFGMIEQQSENANRVSTKEVVNIVNRSDWVNNTDLVRGQVFYAWLVCLYFFGFARHSLDQVASVADTVEQWIRWCEQHPNCNMYQHNQKITKWWQSWSNGEPVPDLSRFPDHDTVHWSPYTHLASWLQQDPDRLYQDLQAFGLATEQDSHSAVRYGQTYPCVTDQNQIISIDHEPPEFASEFEFCRFYYWWRRKRGLSRTVIGISNTARVSHESKRICH